MNAPTRRLLRLENDFGKTQKSRHFLRPHRAKSPENRRVKVVNRDFWPEDFCGMLIGAPRPARKSKSRKTRFHHASLPDKNRKAIKPNATLP
jgi:hypothetical protein